MRKHSKGECLTILLRRPNSSGSLALLINLFLYLFCDLLLLSSFYLLLIAIIAEQPFSGSYN